jgi:SAM-dependent methyltransferase
MNQSLEHISNTEKTIEEIRRILKPGGLLIVTTPHTMKNHSHAIASSESAYSNFYQPDLPFWQNDFFRFTKYGLISLFQDFSIISISESTGYFGSIHQLINYFFASFRRDLLFSPIYFINNLSGIVLDFLFSQTKHIPLPFAQKFYHFIFSSLTINLIMIAQKKSNG